jgi:hypothetical protein
MATIDPEALVSAANLAMRRLARGKRENCIGGAMAVFEFVRKERRAWIVPALVGDEHGFPEYDHELTFGPAGGHMIVLAEGIGVLDSTCDQDERIGCPLVVNLTNKQIHDFMKWRTNITFTLPGGTFTYKRLKVSKSEWLNFWPTDRERVEGRKALVNYVLKELHDAPAGSALWGAV